jgi:hypothetical protein
MLVVLLIAVAYVLLADRKIWAAVQIRRGPNVVGPWGLLQSFADLLKFVFKEPTIPAGANKGVFLLAPLVTCVLALAAWAVIPVNADWMIADINVGVLYIFAISSLMVYGVIMAGWASNSKYPFLSALRSAAQMVSYEVSIGFVFVTVLLCVGSLNLSDVVNAQGERGIATALGIPWFSLLNWYWLPLFPMFIVFFISSLAAVRPGRGGVGTGRRLHGRVRLDPVHDVHARRVRGHRHHVRHDRDPVPGRLAAAACGPTVHLGARHHLVRAQGRLRVLHVRAGESLCSALPLRPADAGWLESVLAAVAGDDRDRGGGAAIWRARPEMSPETRTS